MFFCLRLCCFVKDEDYVCTLIRFWSYVVLFEIYIALCDINTFFAFFGRYIAFFQGMKLFQDMLPFLRIYFLCLRLCFSVSGCVYLFDVLLSLRRSCCFLRYYVCTFLSFWSYVDYLRFMLLFLRYSYSYYLFHEYIALFQNMMLFLRIYFSVLGCVFFLRLSCLVKDHVAFYEIMFVLSYVFEVVFFLRFTLLFFFLRRCCSNYFFPGYLVIFLGYDVLFQDTFLCFKVMLS